MNIALCAYISFLSLCVHRWFSYLVYGVRSVCVCAVAVCIYGDTHPFRHRYYDNIHSMQSVLMSEKCAGGKEWERAGGGVESTI